MNEYTKRFNDRVLALAIGTRLGDAHDIPYMLQRQDRWIDISVPSEFRHVLDELIVECLPKSWLVRCVKQLAEHVTGAEPLDDGELASVLKELSDLGIIK